MEALPGDYTEGRRTPIDLGLVPESSLTEINAAKDKVMAAITGLVAEAREGWSPPDWSTDKAAPRT